jgi:hypothetical protein
MSDEYSTLPAHLGEHKHAHVFPAMRKFNEAVERGTLVEGAGGQYASALHRYEEEIKETPGAPGWITSDAADPAGRRGLEIELDWVASELSKIVRYLGGILPIETAD